MSFFDWSFNNLLYLSLIAFLDLKDKLNFWNKRNNFELEESYHPPFYYHGFNMMINTMHFSYKVSMVSFLKSVYFFFLGLFFHFMVLHLIMSMSLIFFF